VIPSLVEATVVIDTGSIDNVFELLCSPHNVTKLEISTFPSLDMVRVLLASLTLFTDREEMRHAYKPQAR
jgi:hypothetical protein